MKSMEQTASLPFSYSSDPIQVGHFCTTKPTASPNTDDPSDIRFCPGFRSSIIATAAHLWQNRQRQSGHTEWISHEEGSGSSAVHAEQK